MEKSGENERMNGSLIERNKDKIKLGLLMLVVLCVIILNYKYSVEPQLARDKPILVNTRGERTDIVGLKGGDTIEQSFQVEDCNIKKFSLWINSTKMNSKSKIVVSLKNISTDEIIQEWEKEIDSEHGDAGITFHLDKLIQVKEKNQFLISIELGDDLLENELSFKQSEWNAYAFGEMKINSKVQKGDMAFWIYDGPAVFIKYMYWAFGILIMVGTFVLLKNVDKKSFDEKKVFLFIASIIGILFMVFWSPFAAPDECRHYATAYYYSNLLLGEEPRGENGEVLIREEDLKFNNQEEFTRLSTYSLIFDELLEKSDSNRMIESGEQGLDVSWSAYFPAIIGISVARLLDLSCVGLLFFGRGFSLLFYLLIGWMTIYLIPHGKKTMMCLLLFPGIIQMGVSFSYDNMIDSLFFLYFAYILYLKEKGKTRVVDVILISIILCIAAPIKFIYIFLGIFCIFLLGDNIKRKILWSLPFISCSLVSLVQKIITIQGKLNVSHLERADRWSISLIFANPIKCFCLCWNTIIEKLECWIKEMVWGFPEYSAIKFPDILPWIFIIILIITLFEIKKNSCFDRKNNIVIAFVSFLILGELLGVFLLEPLTSFNSTIIGGIQGRYFLPCIPWILFAVAGKLKTTNINTEKYIRFIPIGIFILNIMFVNIVISSVIIR